MNEHNSGGSAAAQPPAGTVPEGIEPGAPGAPLRAGGPDAPAGIDSGIPGAPPAGPGRGGAALAPPAWSGRRIALLIGGIFTGVVAFITVIALLAIFVAVPMWRASNPDWLVANAARRLEAAQALHVRGSFLDIAGRRVELDVRVGADGFTGAQRIDGQRADIRSSGGKTYVKGTAAFWTIVQPDSAGAYADTWVLAGAEALRLQVDPYLEPRTLARALREERDERLGKAAKRPIRGIDTMRISLPSGGYAYIARQEPYGVVRIESPILGGGPGTYLAGYALDIDEMSAADLGEFEESMEAISTETAGALDPNDEAKLPAFYTVEETIDADDPCGAVSCQFQAKVTNLRGPARPGAKHLLMGVVREGKEGTGKVLGRCEAVLKPLAKGAIATVSCVMSDPRWASWARSSPGWYAWQLTTFNPGWDGDSAAVIAQLMEGKADPEHIDDVASEASEVGLRTLLRLIQYPGASHADAVAAIKAAATSGHLDLLHAYAESGRIGNLKGLRKYLEDAAAERHTIVSALPRSNQFQAAVTRAKDGKGPVALESWTGGGVTVKADVVDVGRKEAIQIRTVVGKDTDVVVSTAGSAVGAIAAPATFQRILDLRVANQLSPLYGLGKAELRDALRKAGMKAAFDTVVIVNGTGRHEYGPAEFR